MTTGKFVVIEGIDGAGTTTQTQLLGELLRSRGLPVLTTREPTGGPIGALLRQALGHRFVVPGVRGPRPPGWATMALLFAADRLDHLEAEIVPSLREGVWVISDRYDLSSLAYQSLTAEASPDEDVLGWLRAINGRAQRPDLTIVIDVPASVAAQRRGVRGQATELYEVDDLQRRLADAYLRAEELLPGDRIVHLDGSASPVEVAAGVARAIESLR